MLLPPSQLRARGRKIKLLLLDVDGVLTDGRIFYLPGPHGNIYETKSFDSRDGLGIRLAQAAGLKIGIISGRSSPAVRYRAKELDLDFLEEHALEKLAPYKKILRAADLRDEQICYVGDDIVDLPILKRVGLAVGVSSGHAMLRRFVHYCTTHPGGRGAVRETIELVLKAQDQWDSVSKRFFG